jgi:modulator of FtsH protease HflC
MKAIRYILIVVAVVASLIVLLSSAFVVQETDQVVITQFGKPVGKAITTPGLHFKTPFIQKAIYFDKRFLEWDGDPNQIPTKDKKFIFIDTYARWQITDPLQFFKRMTNERGAQSRLDDIIDGETRDIIANNNIEEAVRTSNRTPISSGASSDMVGDTLIDIQTGREAPAETHSEIDQRKGQRPRYRYSRCKNLNASTMWPKCKTRCTNA